MNDSEYTLTSPVSAAARADGAMLGFTIAWHPDRQRIGAQFVCASGAQALALSRYLPLFRLVGSDGLGLGYSGISREPLTITRDAEDGVTICPPHSRMAVEVNGVEIAAAVHLTRAQIEAGVVLGLGRAVLLCLHWMRHLPKRNPVDGLLGVGDAAIRTRDLIRQAAGDDVTVLLLGETGTGKEVAARGIHALGARANAPLVCVNMAALNETLAAADLFGAHKGAYTGAQEARVGLFAEAQDATLFLDEIGNTPPQVQPMLLRVLETGDYRPLGAQRDRQTNARLIAATDQDLYGGGFNQALLRRLESFIIHIPPLRARREDIGMLLVHLLQTNKLARAADIDLPVALISRFINYDWPGNIRQLTHVFKRAVMALQQGETPNFDNLADIAPEPVTGSAAAMAASAPLAATGPDAPAPLPNGNGRKRLADLGEQAVLAAMERNDWHIQSAAQTLGISRPSMYKLLAAHSQIRRAERIAPEEIALAVAQYGGDVEDCAAHLKTPTEALRRHLRVLGMIR
jgi:two-component system nitrogen regulation response regulator GlnG